MLSAYNGIKRQESRQQNKEGLKTVIRKKNKIVSY